VSVSIYPGTRLEGAALAAVVQTADEHGVRLRLKHFHSFRESYSELGTPDRGLVERIYRTCQMANVWRCHTVLNGYLYRCPQSAFLPSVVQWPEPDGEAPADGLPIADSPAFAQRLLAFLESPEPLRVCTRCLGSVGRLFEHRQTPRPTWRAQQEHRTEELVDWEHLDMLERNPGMLVRDTSFLPAPGHPG